MPRYVLPQYLLVGVLAFFTPLLHVSAHILRPRDCSFTWRAISGDTCASMANAWSISEAQFISFNPGVDCAALVVGKEYCLEWQGTPPPLPSSQSPTSVPKPTSTTFKTSTTPAPTGPVAPSPTQEGLAKDCKFRLKGSQKAEKKRGLSEDELTVFYRPKFSSCSFWRHL